MLFLWVLCVLGVVFGQDEADNLVVNTTSGALRGVRVDSESGTIFYAYRGIPYAKPPVGELRFMPPQPMNPWDGVRDASKQGSRCFQYRVDTRVYEGVEDCLYMNVYTPQLPGNGSELLPVMAWIHPGGYVWGAADEADYGPEFLVGEGVLYVNFNYRVSVTGFICLEDATISCNNGLKDQNAALRWIQENIVRFGGDPKQVTLFGVSSGSAAVNQHMVSPMSDGLFQKAIAQSGGAFSPWGWEFHPRRQAFSLGLHLGYHGNDSQELIDYLRKVDIGLLCEAADRERDQSRLMSFSFAPGLEPEVEGVERFVVDHPLKLLEEGKFKDIPFMSGYDSVEGMMDLIWFNINNTQAWKRLDQFFELSLIPELRVPEDYPNKSAIVAKFREFYFQNKPISIETLTPYVDMYSDLHFSEGVDRTLRTMSSFNRSSVYYYMFSMDGRLNNFKKAFHVEYYPGACHGDEQGSMYRIAALNPVLERGAPELRVRSQVVKMWTNFAKTGNPTPEETDLLPVKWEPYNIDTKYYMDIDRELALKQAPHGDRMQFYVDLYDSL